MLVPNPIKQTTNHLIQWIYSQFAPLWICPSKQLARPTCKPTCPCKYRASWYREVPAKILAFTGHCRCVASI